MSTRRRKKTCKEKSTNSSTSSVSDGSSTDSEYSKTLRIINQLSRKYMSSSSNRSSSRKKSTKMSPGKEYEGDIENLDSSDITNTSSPESSSISAYDFDEEDPVEIETSSNGSKKTKNKAGNKKKSKTLVDENKKGVNLKKKSEQKSQKSVCTPTERKLQISDFKRMGRNSSLTEKTDNTKPVKTPKEKKKISFSSTMLDMSAELSSLDITTQRTDVSNIENCQRQLRKRKSDASNSSVSPPKVKRKSDTSKSSVSSPKVKRKSDTSNSSVSSPKVKRKSDTSNSSVSSPKVKRKSDTPNSSISSPKVKRKSDTSNSSISSPKVKKTHTRSPQDTSSASKIERGKRCFKRDSGVCLSPPHHAKKVPLLSTKDTSTPSHESHTVSKSTRGHYFGFSNDPTLDVSPVNARTPITPMSDYASMETDSLSYSLSFGNSSRKSMDHEETFELFSREEDNELSVNKSVHKPYKPRMKTIVHKKTSGKNKKVDDLAEKLNTEFSDIERYELHIDG